MEYNTFHLSSGAEDKFIELFSEVFGIENTQYLVVQYPVVDMYGNNRFIDFALESEGIKIAVEIDGEYFHDKRKISDEKYYDELLRQNSIIHDNWKLYRWTDKQLDKFPDMVKDQLLYFVGDYPKFRELTDYLPKQKGKIVELREHQKEALDNLNKMRQEGNSIALIYHATGTGKTVTAVADAKAVGKKTLFLAHRNELISQAYDTFEEMWPDADVNMYAAETKSHYGDVVCGSIQSVNANLEQFKPDEFGYIIIDEAHHSAADSYKKILGYFKPEFTLGLTATPERADGEQILNMFKNVAHKLDLKTAVERDELVPVRCIRIKTNIDLTNVRFNGIKYNFLDLESKMYIPERNNLIVDTYLNYVIDKKTVIFCVSVKHGDEIARLLQEKGVAASSVSGSTNPKKRKEILSQYENGDIDVLCACDLLNEGWDSPKTEVLFMARPTMSKTIYMQQLGRGMRKFQGKECLLVFDFVDNANMFNEALSIHRMFNIKDYRPGSFVLAPDAKNKLEMDLWRRGEKPDILLEMPVYEADYEEINIFNWRDEVKNMISQNEFVRMVTAQSETVSRYINEGKIIPDRIIETGYRNFNFFKEETVKKYAEIYKWDLITPANMKDKFMDMVEKMDMSYSYKPVLLHAMLENADDKGRVSIEDIIDYFIFFYEDRRKKGLVVEKKNCIYLRHDYTRKEVMQNILRNPFKRFEEMGFMKRSKDLEYVEFNKNIWNKLTDSDIKYIINVCNNSLSKYYDENR
ncbi:DEAD/DEAH box helicase [Sedimentibacter saalensis]|uniref:DEAD/DEAH box helicase n=1 Tax=Sedimentibacter saalensis TaxID=130788 RepID=UPI00289C2D8F|nr:DEAD/DEAH box helicase family protein [Sedimentibacter saalensis]